MLFFIFFIFKTKKWFLNLSQTSLKGLFVFYFLKIVFENIFL